MVELLGTLARLSVRPVVDEIISEHLFVPLLERLDNIAFPSTKKTTTIFKHIAEHPWCVQQPRRMMHWSGWVHEPPP